MLFLDNKYTKWYYKIIAYAVSSDRKKVNRTHPDYVYYERHHIVPKSMGGSNTKPNMVLLTAKEHFIVHGLLYRMTTGQDKSNMAHAWARFSGKHNDRYFNSLLFTASKVKAPDSLETREKKRLASSRPKTKEHLMAIRVGQKLYWQEYRKTHPLPPKKIKVKKVKPIKKLNLGGHFDLQKIRKACITYIKKYESRPDKEEKVNQRKEKIKDVYREAERRNNLYFPPKI